MAKKVSKVQKIRAELLVQFDAFMAKGVSSVDARAEAVVRVHTHGKVGAGRDTLWLAHQFDAALNLRATEFDHDFQIESHGSISLVRPLNKAAAQWLVDTCPEDAQFMGNAMVVEPRYVFGVIDAIDAHGLSHR